MKFTFQIENCEKKQSIRFPSNINVEKTLQYIVEIIVSHAHKQIYTYLQYNTNSRMLSNHIFLEIPELLKHFLQRKLMHLVFE